MPFKHLIITFVLIVSSVRVIAADRPNVLFLFADDQRPDSIAALGKPAIKTPHLDALAKRGFVFRNAYCMGSTMGAVCNPSRHMTLSGNSLYRYDPKQKEGTWGDVFRKAGYVTYHQSKRGNTAREYHKAFEYSSYLNDGAERKSGHHGRAAANNAIEFLNETWDREKPLFNLKNDPDELHTLAADPKYADRLAEMMQILEAEQDRWDDTQPHTVDNPRPAEITDVAFFSNPKNAIKPNRKKRKKTQ